MAGAATLGRTALFLLPFQIVFRAGEALFPILLAVWFGHDAQTDLLTFSAASFGFFGSLVFSLYQDSALIPVLAEARARDAREIPQLLGSMLAHTLMLGGALALCIGVGFAGYASLRYEHEMRRLALLMVPTFSVYLVALSVKTFLAAVLTFERRFVVQPVVSGVAMAANLSTIFLLRGTLGVACVPLGMLLGEAVGCAGLYAALLRAGVSIRWNFERPVALRDAAKLLVAEVGGSAITRVNPVVDQLMANLFVVAGAGTLLKYSGDLSTVPTSLLQATLLPVLIAHLSDAAVAGEMAEFRRTVGRTVLIVVAVLTALCLLMMLVRVPLCILVFRRGAMDEAGARGIADILPYHLAGVPGFGALLVFARAHVALKNSRIMISMGIINAVANAVFNVALVSVLGARGLALSTSFVSTVVAVVFGFRLRVAYARREVVTEAAS